MEKEFVFADECYAIRGALFEVYKNLGVGFTEDVYQLALEMELGARNIPFAAQKEFFVSYKGNLLDKTFKTDFVCYDKIIIEIKSVQKILPEHEAQLINYLRVANFRLGFLVNFRNYPMLYTQQHLNAHYVKL